MILEPFFVELANRFLRPKAGTPKARDLVVGTTTVLDRVEPVILPERARCAHLTIMGTSGTGKSYLLENLIRQDIRHRTGAALFDWHGDLAENIIAYLAEEARAREEVLDRVVIIEPFDETHTIGFNPLERTRFTSPFVQAQELAHILRLRWKHATLGPRSEELLRAALYTLSARNLTLLELPRLLTDASFRRVLVRYIEEKAVADYWRGQYDQRSEAMQAQMRMPILSRVSAFLTVPQVREIVGQKSTFSFDEAIRKNLWVVINLSKGLLGDENSEVLGSLLFTKLQFDVLAQARIPEHERKLFVVYADELQNLVGSFGTLIAEARKYRLSAVAGQQYWRQLSPELRAAMLGAGSRMLFRVSYHDARELAGELDPRGKERMVEELASLKDREAVFRTGSERPVKVRVEEHEQAKSTPAEIEALKAHARNRYATNRKTIQEDIQRRFERGAVERISKVRQLSEEVE